MSTILHNEKSGTYEQNFGMRYVPAYSIEHGVTMQRNTNVYENLNNLWVRASEYEDVVSELLATKQAYNNLFNKLSVGVVGEIRELKQARLDLLYAKHTGADE